MSNRLAGVMSTMAAGLHGLVKSLDGHGVQIVVAIIAFGMTALATAVTVTLSTAIAVMDELADARIATDVQAETAAEAARAAAEAARAAVEAAETAGQEAEEAREQAEVVRERFDETVDGIDEVVTELESSVLSRLQPVLEAFVTRNVDEFQDETMRRTLLAAISVYDTTPQVIRDSVVELDIGVPQRVEIARHVQSILRIDVEMQGKYEFRASVENVTSGGDSVRDNRDLNPVVYLYGEQPLRLLEMNDDGGLNNNAVVEYPLVTPGTYYIGVGDPDGETGRCIVSVQMTEFLIAGEEI